jgi:hypothetical protein
MRRTYDIVFHAHPSKADWAQEKGFALSLSDALGYLLNTDGDNTVGYWKDASIVNVVPTDRYKEDSYWFDIKDGKLENRKDVEFLLNGINSAKGNY